MRASILFLFAMVIALVAIPDEARADQQKVRTNQSTKVFARRGEQAKVLMTLEKGTVMKRLKTQGRWVQVRVKFRTGWVPRSVLDMPPEEVARNTRRRPFVDGRGTKRGFGGEEGPDDRIGADAVGEGGRGDGEDEEDDAGDDDSGDDADDDKPSKPTKPAAKPGKPGKTVATKDGGKADAKDEEDEDAEVSEDEEEDPSGEGRPEEEEDTGPPRKTVRVAGKTSIFEEADEESDVVFKADADMPLYPTGNKSGKYIEVENDEGDIGYVLASDVEIDEGSEDGEDDAGPRRRHIDFKARLGVTIMQQGMRTGGGGEGIPNNYNLTTSAATLALGGTVLFPWKQRLVVGGELAFDAAANTGITVPNAMEATKIRLYNVNTRAVIGYDLRKKSGMMVFGRLGLRYESFQVSDVGLIETKNKGLLPSEIVIAPSIGAALALPRLTDKIGLRFSVDSVLFGSSVKQTKRLEDGANPSAKGALFGVGFTYAWKQTFFIQAAYDLNFFKKSFGAPVEGSMRQHNGMSSSRTDVFHQATVGVARAF